MSQSTGTNLPERPPHRLSILVVIGLIVIGASLAAPRPAQAVLMELDLNSPGDKLLTLDTSTGLEWLDITETTGLNYFPAEATVFVTSQGFRHASQSEVNVLLSSFGISPGGDTVANLVPVKTALDFMGNLNAPGDENHFLQGVYEFNTTQLGATLLQVNPFSTDTTGSATLVQGSIVSKTTDFGGFFGIGHYLVREHVDATPEPSTFVLATLGLLSLGMRRRRRQLQLR